MPLINVKLIDGVFSPGQKKQIVEKITDAMVSVEGEAMRPVTWVIIEEVKGGDWAIGGRMLTAADVHAMAWKQAAGSLIQVEARATRRTCSIACSGACRTQRAAAKRTAGIRLRCQVAVVACSGSANNLFSCCSPWIVIGRKNGSRCHRGLPRCFGRRAFTGAACSGKGRAPPCATK